MHVHPAVIITVLAGWFVAATAFVATGALGRMSLPPPVVVVGLAIAITAPVLASRTMRAWLLTTDVRPFLALHLVRFVGIAFLILVQRGTLSPAFVPIGWGDAIAAVGAVALLVTGSSAPSRGWWRALLAWNVFGLADMMMLVATGIRLGLVDPGQFALFRQLPFGLLPTFFVPLIIATHVFIFVKLFARRERASGDSEHLANRAP
jgi:hypothetical protein